MIRSVRDRGNRICVAILKLGDAACERPRNVYSQPAKSCDTPAVRRLFVGCSSAVFALPYLRFRLFTQGVRCIQVERPAFTKSSWRCFFSRDCKPTFSGMMSAFRQTSVAVLADTANGCWLTKVGRLVIAPVQRPIPHAACHPTALHEAQTQARFTEMLGSLHGLAGLVHPMFAMRCSASAALVASGEPALSEPRASLPGYLRKFSSSG